MSPSFPTTLWTVTMVSPDGLPLSVKIRAASQQEAIDRLLAMKGAPWRVGLDEHGNPLIRREALLG